MPPDDPARLHGALEALADALQTAALLSGSIARSTDALTAEVFQLESAVSRAVFALRTLQPQTKPEGGAH
jgi:hypothetical protein